jgi:SAM-dependent methyltransferase
MNPNAELYNRFDIQPLHIRDFLIWLAQSYQLPAQPHFLDMGCGPGRVLEPMAALSWQVTGFEPDADYCAAAAKIAEQNSMINVRQAGFAELDEQETYHIIAALNAPFAYLLDIPSRLDALARMYRALHPNGIIFLDFPNFLWILRHYRPPQESAFTDENGDKFRRVTRHDLDWHSSTFTHSDTFYRNDQYLSTQVHRMGIVAPQTIISLLEQAGFTDIRTYNSFANRESQRINQQRIMLSARKPL